MSNKLIRKPNDSPEPISRFESNPNNTFDEFKLNLLDEFHGQIMVGVFLASAFTVVIYFNITLITVLIASRFFAMIGGIGFILLFALRQKWRLSLLDGFFYNLFGIAPLGLAMFLVLNAQCSETFTKSYAIASKERGGSGYTLTLENNALDEFWHIRNVSIEETNIGYGSVEYTFCDGLFGYTVVREVSIK